jgi:predicted phosphate transport protein (TIGR00153 family)
MVLDEKRFHSQELANVTQMLEEHFRIVQSANKMVTNALFSWLEENQKISTEDLVRVTELEEKGDSLKHQILTQLAQANTLMQREDLLRLLHYNDKLIDGAEIACYHLAAVINSWVPEGKLKDKLLELGKAMTAIIDEQREAVLFLSINIQKSIEKADEICKIEKRIDIIQREIITILYASDLKIATLLRFRDFLNMLEDVANFSEDAAITMRGLSLTLNT